MGQRCFWGVDRRAGSGTGFLEARGEGGSKSQPGSALSPRSARQPGLAHQALQLHVGDGEEIQLQGAAREKQGVRSLPATAQQRLPARALGEESSTRKRWGLWVSPFIGVVEPEDQGTKQAYLMKNLFQVFWHCWRSAITSRSSLAKALPFSSMLCERGNSLFWMLSDIEMTSRTDLFL